MIFEFFGFLDCKFIPSISIMQNIGLLFNFITTLQCVVGFNVGFAKLNETLDVR